MTAAVPLFSLVYHEGGKNANPKKRHRLFDASDRQRAPKHAMLWLLPAEQAPQGFSARRRRNEVKICEKSGQAPDFSHFDRASVRPWRARSPMQIPSSIHAPRGLKACRKCFFRQAQASIVRCIAIKNAGYTVLSLSWKLSAVPERFHWPTGGGSARCSACIGRRSGGPEPRRRRPSSSPHICTPRPGFR